MQTNEITIFRPNSTKREATISSPIIIDTVNALEERLGEDAAKKARRTFTAMRKEGLDFVQFKEGERRIRLKLVDA